SASAKHKSASTKHKSASTKHKSAGAKHTPARTEHATTKHKHAEPVAIEPAPLHSDYQENTRKLGEAYKLRDRAWNDEVENNYGAAVEHLQGAITLSKEYYGEKSPLLGPIYLELAQAASLASMPDTTRQALADCMQVNSNSAEAPLRLALL